MTTTTTPSPPGAPPRPLTRLGLCTLLLGAALPMIDFFVVNVALPAVESDLAASPATVEMVVAGYAVAYAVLLVLGGRLGDAYGRRRLFLWGVAGFGLTSLACGLAPGAWWLVGARAAQGAASALLLPQVLATLHASTSGERRARAVALYGSVGGVSVVLGQVLGGILVAADLAGTGWRAVFLVNVPVAAAALGCALRSVPDSRAERPARGDLAGTALLAAALTAVLLPLTEGRAARWPVWSVLLLCASPLLAAAFWRVERRGEASGGAPLLPPSLLGAPGVRRGLLLGVPVFTGFAGWMFVGAVALQEGLGYGSLRAGLTLVPMGVAQFGASVLAPRAVRRLGGRAVALAAAVHVAGLATVTAAFLLGSWPGLSPLALAPGLVLCGAAQGLELPLYYRVVLAAVPARLAGTGSGLAATLQQSCLAVGVAALGSLFLSLTPALGMRDALAVTLAVQSAGLLWLGALGLRLPRALG
ncbi:MFS transporter [Streptomyces lucensis JCM 4490]|uniref:MFS transporter n=1 Tax=Streptomyces lucensis JCM 4490 TaxID=1306176 RepID=A0A918IZS5_9ACTN|nr:MFS transporter [Streptomyces lucensis]GGW38384.1 MFS transporter [Streptomyces lucensis JCM 4490]